MQKFFLIQDQKKKNSKTKLFLYSITTGLIISLFFVYLFDQEPFSPLFNGIKATFKSDLKINFMIRKMVLLALAGMAVGIGFKTQIFNIGVSGQMMIGGMTAGLFALNVKTSIPNGLGQIIVVLISVFVASIFAGLAGILKAYFKIHEVVSTILMNWIAFYFLKWMLDPNTSTILNQANTASQTISSNYLLRINGNPFWPIMIILLLTALLLWLFIYKTRYGMILKMTGINPHASKFAGINEKLVLFYSMAISGAVAGLLGAVFYFGNNTNFAVPQADAIPSEGFNGIAIAIISYSHPLAIIIVSFFFSMVQSGVVNSAGLINVNFIFLILGVLMYLSAINKIFIYLQWTNLVRKLKKLFLNNQQEALYVDYLTSKEQVNLYWYNQYNLAKKQLPRDKLKQTIKFIINDHRSDLQKLKEKYHQQKKLIQVQRNKQ